MVKIDEERWRAVHKRIIVMALFLMFGAVLIPVAGARAAPATLNQTTQSGNSITGTWLVTVNITGVSVPETQAVSFTSDGLVIATNTPTQPVQPGQGPPNVSRTYSTNDLGVWSQTGDGQFLFTMVSVNYDDTGATIDVDKVIATFSMNAAGDSLNGQFRLEVSDPMGNLLFASPGPIGQFTGTRIAAEPFEQGS